VALPGWTDREASRVPWRGPTATPRPFILGLCAGLPRPLRTDLRLACRTITSGTLLEVVDEAEVAARHVLRARFGYDAYVAPAATGRGSLAVLGPGTRVLLVGAAPAGLRERHVTIPDGPAVVVGDRCVAWLRAWIAQGDL
jgi:hypothetical protein